jgi:hypothetical protein
MSPLTESSRCFGKWTPEPSNLSGLKFPPHAEITWALGFLDPTRDYTMSPRVRCRRRSHTS